MHNQGRDPSETYRPSTREAGVTKPLEPLCRYCDNFAVACRTSGPRASRTFRCDDHRHTEDLDPGVVIHERPTYEDLRLSEELMPAMRAAWRLRKRRAGKAK